MDSNPAIPLWLTPKQAQLLSDLLFTRAVYHKNRRLADKEARKAAQGLAYEYEQLFERLEASISITKREASK